VTDTNIWSILLLGAYVFTHKPSVCKYKTWYFYIFLLHGIAITLETVLSHILQNYISSTYGVEDIERDLSQIFYTSFWKLLGVYFYVFLTPSDTWYTVHLLIVISFTIFNRRWTMWSNARQI
jgi:hypothetical protein